jgi:hypothetical protein
MELDGNTILTAILVISTAFGGFLGGRMTGRTVESQVAVDTVDMLTSQIDLLKQDRDLREVELTNLRGRVTILEGLVTQRAEVEALTEKVSLVKDTVDRIAVKMGA